MKQIVVTLENDADSNLLRRMIESMKGVIKARVQNDSHKTSDRDTEVWIEDMKNLSQMVSPSIADLNDEKTQYLMSK